ncbi:MAG TPA: hypothetical protein VFV95_06945 [Vicinamibacterales bacterium]|nr:hypothetical protein [Vicinamibacterales bacterium]
MSPSRKGLHLTGESDAPGRGSTNDDTQTPRTAAPGSGTPQRTFTKRLTLLSGKDSIDLYHFGPAHTGDTFVVFRNLRIMYAGHAFTPNGLPSIDRFNGGRGLSFTRTLAAAVGAIARVDTVIGNQRAGSSSIYTWQEFTDCRELHSRLSSAAADAVRDGVGSEAATKRRCILVACG